MNDADPDRIDRILENVVRMQGHGAHDTAIHLLRSALGEDPNHALAHALLCASLLHKKRVHAAEAEAGMALALDPELSLAHLMMASVLVARRRFEQAHVHLVEARALAPESAAALVVQARLAVMEDDRETARALLDEARALEPDDLDVVIALGDLAVLERRMSEAQGFAREALAIEPDGAASHVLAGRVALFGGNDEEAREHAALALRADPTDTEALGLLAGARARRSLVLGLWWRWHAAVARLGERGQVLVLIGTFVVVRLAVIFMNRAGHEGAAWIAEKVWLAFCVYTWVGPAMFKRAVDKELKNVSLRRDY